MTILNLTDEIRLALAEQTDRPLEIEAVPKQWTTSTLLLIDGRVINGVITRKTDQSWTVQTAQEERILPADEVEDSQPTNLSLMPEGQLNAMSEGDVRNLVGYLQTSGQVPLVE